MASHKDISSTEKLLDVIRGSGGSADAGISREKAPSVKKAPLFQIFSGKASKAPTVVGVDVGYHELRLVKISQEHEGKRRLKDFKRIPFIEGVNPDSPEFVDFLRKALTDFCGRGSNFELWALMQSGEVEVQHVRVPKMSSKKVHDAVYFLAKKNVPFDEKNTIFDYGIQGEVIEGGVQKLAVVAYTSPREEVRKVAALFDKAGFPLTGLTIAPFAIQNIFKTNWIPSAGKVVVTLYIGRDWSRIDIYNDGNFVMTRGIKTGINSMIESLMDEYNHRVRRTQIGVVEDAEQAAMAAREYEKISMTIEDAREILYGVARGTKTSGGPGIERYGLRENEVGELIQPAIERLVRQIERTFEHFISTFGAEKIDVIYVSSAVGVYKPIVEYIGEQLRMESDVLDPMNPEIPSIKGVTSGVSLSERVDFLPALGLALSDNAYTLNNIFTYKEKKKQMITHMANVSVMAAFSILLIISLGYYFWLGHIASTKEETVAQYKKQLSADIPVDERIIAGMMKKVQEEKKLVQEYKNRYLGMAAISELSSITPSNIRLFSMAENLKPTALAGGQALPQKSVTISGVVLGEQASLESALAGYVYKIEHSPIFGKPSIITQTQEQFEGKTVLRFSLIAAL